MPSCIPVLLQQMVLVATRCGLCITPGNFNRVATWITMIEFRERGATCFGNPKPGGSPVLNTKRGISGIFQTEIPTRTVLASQNSIGPSLADCGQTEGAVPCHNHNRSFETCIYHPGDPGPSQRRIPLTLTWSIILFLRMASPDFCPDPSIAINQSCLL